uniref:ATP synthase subunit epsilon, mitochondrial n=1 Tax=Panthera leo TaxID=9689 RepID=A0A8C8WWS0_PANLE
MTSWWREAGPSYIPYSQICAKAVRDVLRQNSKQMLRRFLPKCVKVRKL